MKPASTRDRLRLPAGVAGLLVWLGVCTAQTPEIDALQSQIDEAARLNLTAPWEESQSILDELGGAMADATPRQRAQVAFLNARNLALAGRYDEAMNLSLTLHAPEVDPEYRLRGLRLSANIALQRDHFEDAYIYLRDGLELLPEVTASEPKVNLLALTAYFYGIAGEGEKAIEAGRRALDIAQASGDLRAECVAHHDLGVAQVAARRVEDAMQTQRRALIVCEAARDPVHIAASRYSLGQSLIDNAGDKEAAIEFIRAGIEGFQSAGYRDGVLNGSQALARAMVARGELAAAEEILEPLLVEFERLDYWRNLEVSHGLLSQIAEARGDFEQALAHQRSAESAGERLLGRERAIRIAYLQVELDMRAKEQEIALLTDRNQILQLREEAQKQRRVLIFGGMAALAIIGALLLMMLIRSRFDRRALLWLSQHDGLTGLRNHTSFFRHANEALSASRQARQPFTLVLADIDFFKAINDQHGHIAGDRALEEVGRLLRAVFEPLGPVGRIGGEEFAMALPGLRAVRARELIDEFNERLQQTAPAGIRMTMSFGVVQADANQCAETLRKVADEALYEAKECGRNQVVDASDGGLTRSSRSGLHESAGVG